MQEETNGERDHETVNDPENEINQSITDEPQRETNPENTNETDNEAIHESINGSNGQRPDESDDNAITETIGETYTVVDNNGTVPAIAPLPKSKKQKILIAAALLLIGFLLVQLGQIIAANMNPKAYLGKAWKNTLKTYQQELMTMQKNNPVLKKYGEIVTGPSQHQLSFDSILVTDGLMGMSGVPSFNLEFVMINDPDKNQFQFGTDFPLIGGAYIYLSDQEAIVSILNENYTLDAKRAGEEIRTFLGNNEIDYDESLIPEDLDISYDTISKPITEYKADEILPSHSKVWKRYSAEWKKLYDTAKLTRVNGTTSLGDEEVKCTAMVLTFAAQDIRDWFAGLYEMAKEDSELEDVLAENYKNILNTLEYGKSYEDGDVTATFFIYKDTVIETFLVSSPGGTRSTISFAARGKDYRLDHIDITSWTEDEGETKNRISLRGNHIGQGIFTSQLSSNENTALVTWDPEGAEDNVSIQWPDADITFTLALDEDGVILKPFSGEDSDILILRAVPVQSGSIIWPVRTTPLIDLNLQEWLSTINPFG